MLPTAQRADGRLHLHFALANGGATRLQVQTQTPPLRVVRAFSTADGAALAHMHNISGGVLGGDQLTLRVQVGAGASAQLTSTGATRVYRHRTGHPVATQENHILVEPGGLLEYLPDTLIPFAGARFCQKTRIELAEGAALFYWEVIAPGRDARNEIFAYDLLQWQLDITADDRLITLERVRLEPALRPLSSAARMGCYRYLATFYICRAGEPANTWLALEKQLAEFAGSLTRPEQVLWGASTLAAHGVTVRALSRTHRAIVAGLPCFWQIAKQHLYQRDAILPRKIY